MSRFTNKVALITGGGTGIGRAVAKALVAEGARVVVTGRRKEPLAELAAEFLDAVRYITTDVTEKGALAKVADSAVYSGSKAAMERITAALAVELGPQGIRVNSVAPGLTKTDMSDTAPQEMVDALVAQTPLGRIGKPEDIARAVVFLASDDASWITGQVLQSSGGLML